MSSKHDSSSKQDSFIYERYEGPDHSLLMRQHKVIRKLGKGGFAQVYKIVNIKNQKESAIKIIKKQKGGGNRYSEHKVLNEVAIMKKLKHPNIVQYISHFQDQVDFNIIMELCENGSYQQMLKKRQVLTQPQVRHYLVQFASILKYLKTQSVIHRDIKPANFFIDSEMNIKLGDFGLATFVDARFLSNKRHTCGTPNYIAPQILLKQKYMYQIDTWSIGVLLYASLYGRPPFETKQKKVQATYQKIKMCEYGFPQNRNISTEAKDLIKNILVSDPQRRLTPDDILNHPFLTNYQIPAQLSIQYLEKPPKKDFLQKYEMKKRHNKIQPRPLLFNQTISIENSSSKDVKQVEEASETKRTQMKRLKPKYRLSDVPCDFILKSQSVKTEITQIESQKKITNLEKDCRTQKKDKNQLKIQIASKIGQIGLKQMKKSCFSNFRRHQIQNFKNDQTIVAQKSMALNVLQKKIVSEPKISNKSRSKPNFQIKKKQLSSFYSNQTIQIIDWLNCQKKNGIAYLLQNGYCGVIFNDNTKIIGNWLFTDCIYQRWQQTFSLKLQGQMQSIDGSDQQIENINKKLDIFGFFLQKFKNKDSIKSYSLFKIQEKGPQPKHFITKYIEKKEMKMFLRRDKEIQCVYKDGSKILINKKSMKLTYISSINQKRVTSIPFEESFTKDRIFKLKIRQICMILRCQTKIWKILERQKNKKQKHQGQIQEQYQKENDKSTNVEKQIKEFVQQTNWGYQKVFNL